MGNCCGTTGDYVFDAFYSKQILPYQEHHLHSWQLDKYDQFYKCVGQPFLNIDFRDFVEDLRKL
jgi:hypothetical protein